MINQNKMTKEDFIKKWNVAFESKEQELEFAAEMSDDLSQLESPLLDKEGLREKFKKFYNEFEWYKTSDEVFDYLISELSKFKQHSDPLYYCNCIPEQGEEIGWRQKRECLKCAKELHDDYWKTVKEAQKNTKPAEELKESLDKFILHKIPFHIPQLYIEMIFGFITAKLPHLQPKQSEWISAEQKDFLTCGDCGRTGKSVRDRGIFNGLQCDDCKEDQDITDEECR